ncbi:hypothetical protein OOZ19_22580 [Saccharopolyspora sp. NFXS83]|uniref:transaldolase family protein n=1 Tax=Saccharopolyspora sp. NFXS83 TaxID=2993560 RepID=UPI00224B578C|nr:transaldolase family protein [Saccharopolyspora sp. NFXS83]MCX2733036.1 hypothetical protein [Saccharopolyspora sp. NFXS83]
MSRVLEKLQRTHDTAEIWWDSSPLDFPAWRDGLLASAPDSATRERWAGRLDRFLDPEDPGRSLVRGVTTNPSLVSASVLSGSRKWAGWLRETGLTDPEDAFSTVYEEVLRRAANHMRPQWDATEGRYGWVSGQLDPRVMFQAQRMREQGRRFAAIAPNLMVKVPGTAQGYQVVRDLVAEGISINGTLSYTVPQFAACVRAVEDGLVEARAAGRDLSRWRAVFTHMIGRFGANVDLQLEAAARGITLETRDLRWAELAILKRIHSMIRQRGLPIKLLLSSLQTDDPADGWLSAHLEQSAGADIAYTCKPSFIAELLRREDEFGEFRPGAIDDEVPDDVLRKLDRLPSFRDAYAVNGMAPAEFGQYGCFISTYAEVMQNNRALLDFAARQAHQGDRHRTPLLAASS